MDGGVSRHGNIAASGHANVAENIRRARQISSSRRVGNTAAERKCSPAQKIPHFGFCRKYIRRRRKGPKNEGGGDRQ